MKEQKIYRRDRSKLWLLISIGILLLMIFAGVNSLLNRKGKVEAIVKTETEWTEPAEEVMNKTVNEAVNKAANKTIVREPVQVLVNRKNPLPKDWECELVELDYGQHIDERAYESLQVMMDDARNEGFSPYICSAYRSHETQIQLFEKEVKKYRKQGYSKKEAEEAAARWVAVPGTSEHELGLAVDIVSFENQRLDESQLDTEVQQWLMENCYSYGFILRYPSEKSDITGIEFEPWHYRYVGREAAMEMKEKNLCLEEYVAQME